MSEQQATANPTTPQESQVDAATMEWLRLWHMRMMHANLRAIVVMGHSGSTGEIPDKLPKARADNFEGLQPYLDALNCDTCRQVYGDPSGPPDW